jgi:solute carrier family 25 (adenine nucleotide translocator) protein 4/5/6/31
MGEHAKPAGGPKKSKLEQLGSDLLIGGSIGAVSKTVMAPVERVKLLMQTQDSNPDVLSGKVKRYTSIGDCFRRVSSEQGKSLLARQLGQLSSICSSTRKCFGFQ